MRGEKVTAFLDELTKGREVSEAKSPGVNYHHLDGDPDSDIALDYHAAVEALWGGDTKGQVDGNCIYGSTICFR